MTALTSERFICTGSNKTDEPLKVEEADTISAPPPPSEKVFYSFPQLLFSVSSA